MINNYLYFTLFSIQNFVVICEAYIDFCGCDYGGFYGECHYGECEYGGCEYGECEYGGCEHGECVYGACEYGECDPNPNPYHNPYPYLPIYWSISVPL